MRAARRVIVAAALVAVAGPVPAAAPVRPARDRAERPAVVERLAAAALADAARDLRDVPADLRTVAD